MEVSLPITREELEALYVMWRCGASYRDLAREHGVHADTLAWCFIHRGANELDRFLVHYKDPN